MTNKIYVLNLLRVGNFIQTELKSKEDLLLSKDKKVIDFMNRYEDYLYTFDPRKIKSFIIKTGLILTHGYYVNRSAQIIINLNGVFFKEIPDEGISLEDKVKVFNEHLYVETNVERIEVPLFIYKVGR